MIHHHSPAVKILIKLSWLLASLGAIATGLLALGNSMGKNWNLWETGWIASNLPWLVQPLQYAIGVAGLIGLISWLMCLGHKHSDKR